MATDPRTTVVGEALVDRVQRPDGSVAESPGGSPANVALTLGRLGRNPTLLTSLGQDRNGELVTEWLTESSVHLTNLATAGSRTGTATAHLDAFGSATYEFDIEWDITVPVEGGADLVHVGSIAALIQPGADTVLHFVEAARPESTITYDPNIRPALIADREESTRRVEQLVTLSDVVKASEEDLLWLYPDLSADEASAIWLARGPSVVIVTLGSGGAFAIAASGRVDTPATTVVVADTVGAGDTFMGAFIDGLMTAGLCGASERSELRLINPNVLGRLLRRSTFAAAVTVSRVGANPPWQDELERAFPSSSPVTQRV